jgi:hypothetical protein
MERGIDSLGNAKMPRKRQGESLRKSVVDGYVTRLKDAGLQRQRFDVVVADLVADKSARKVEVSSIATRYVGVPLTLKSKAAAIQIIRATFIDLVRGQRTHEIASKLTPS